MSLHHTAFTLLIHALHHEKNFKLHILHVQIIYWYCLMQSQANISVILGYEEPTIHHYLDEIYPALGCCDKAGLVRRAFELKVLVPRNGITELNDHHLKKCLKKMNEKEKKDTQKILADISKRKVELKKRK